MQHTKGLDCVNKNEHFPLAEGAEDLLKKNGKRNGGDTKEDFHSVLMILNSLPKSQSLLSKVN